MKYKLYVGVLEQDVVYIGIGQGSRQLHLTSGISTCYAANKHHFTSDVPIEVSVIYETEDKSEILFYERRLIEELNPIWNIMYTDRSGINNTAESRAAKKIPLPRNKSTGYYGVGKYMDRFRAYFNTADKKIHIGYYSSAIEAALGRDGWIIEHGHAVPLNFP